ncbi:hypothetical protein MNBD_GAMMA22-1366 [hydrothermal vent metagenome]|uniref:HTH domain of SpoOJ/ParA/ParB/repB family, involved in chromosome partitioning n=1 Tax=hydrothermal vent metagenome TaxID=652676 RepID=A0A3B1A4D4_9ZZZZ
MSMIKPFAALKPQQEYAADVIAPPYDVLNTAEARERAKGRPRSFLHISKPEIDLPHDTDPYDASVYKKGLENLKKLIDENVLIRDDKPNYYLYKLCMGNQEQIGLVGVASVADYDSNKIRKHEFTRPVKEDDRVNQIDALNAQTGPVFLTYRHNAVIDQISDKISKNSPLYDLTADDGVQHSIWMIDDESDIKQITETFDAMDCLYIADGHHRSAAASRIAKMRDNENANYFLSVLFPDNQMTILDYNRVIKDLNGLSESDILTKIENSFDVEQVEQQVKPDAAGIFGMFLDDKWYRLQIKANLIPSDDPVARLDVSLLQDNLIEPLFNISDPRIDNRIDFVGGIRGLGELEKRVQSGDMKIAFSLFPTSLDDLMSVADANKVMPPKSTWFEPKLADGLVSHVLD